MPRCNFTGVRWPGCWPTCSLFNSAASLPSADGSSPGNLPRANGGGRSRRCGCTMTSPTSRPMPSMDRWSSDWRWVGTDWGSVCWAVYWAVWQAIYWDSGIGPVWTIPGWGRADGNVGVGRRRRNPWSWWRHGVSATRFVLPGLFAGGFLFLQFSPGSDVIAHLGGFLAGLNLRWCCCVVARTPPIAANRPAAGVFLLLSGIAWAMALSR